MPDTRAKLIESAVRPFEDSAEMKFAATQLLEQMVELEAPGAEEAIRRWDEVDGKKRRPAWRLPLYLFLIISAVMWADGLNTVFRHTRFTGNLLVNCFYGYPKLDDPEEPSLPGLSAEQRLLLFGDTSKVSLSEKMKGLWDSDPSNPSYFAFYADLFLNDHGKLPPDFLETARSIDPHNSWFTHVAAGAAAKEAVKKGEQKRSRKPIPKTPEWEILDEARFQEALSLIRQARSQPDYRNPLGDLLKQQAKLLPANTPSEALYAISYIGRHSASELGTRSLVDVMAAKAWQCGETEDVAGLKDLLLDSEALLMKLYGTEVVSFIGELVYKNHAFGLVSHLAPVAQKLDLDEPGRMMETLDRVNRMKSLTRSRRVFPGVNPSEKGGRLASNLLSGLTNNLEHRPYIHAEDLTPGRLIDHEIVARLSAYLVWTGAVVCLIAVWAFRFRSPRLVHPLSLRAGDLLRPSDKGWILALGTGLPFLYVQLLTRLTPLGGRELSLAYQDVNLPEVDSVPLPLLQWTGYLVLVILLSVLTIRWRMSRRAKALVFHQSSNLMLWLAVACAVAFIPVIGSSIADQWEAGVYWAIGLFAVPAIWLAAVVSGVLFIDSPKLIQHAVVARALIPCFATTALLAISPVPLYKAAALRWFERDTLIRVDPEHPAQSKFEYECAVQIRKETRAILGYDR